MEMIQQTKVGARNRIDQRFQVTIFEVLYRKKATMCLFPPTDFMDWMGTTTLTSECECGHDGVILSEYLQLEKHTKTRRKSCKYLDEQTMLNDR